jgi:hypothetical protein
MAYNAPCAARLFFPFHSQPHIKAMISWLSNGHLIHRFEYLADHQPRPFCACLLLACLPAISVCFSWRTSELMEDTQRSAYVAFLVHFSSFEGGVHLDPVLMGFFFI